MPSTLCRQVWDEAIKLELSNFFTRINQGLKSCLVKVLSRSAENCRFWSTLKIVDLNHFYRCQVLCAGEFGTVLPAYLVSARTEVKMTR